jgi:hypothetical protein
MVPGPAARDKASTQTPLRRALRSDVAASYQKTVRVFPEAAHENESMPDRPNSAHRRRSGSTATPSPSRYEHSLTSGQRRAAIAVGVAFITAAAVLALVLPLRWLPLSAVVALAGVHYLRAAWRGRVTVDEDTPAPPWLRERVLRSRFFAWLTSRRRPPS